MAPAYSKEPAQTRLGGHSLASMNRCEGNEWKALASNTHKILTRLLRKKARVVQAPPLVVSNQTSEGEAPPVKPKLVISRVESAQTPSDLDEVTTTSRQKQLARVTPALNAKYAPVWKRLKAKIRMRRTLGNMNRDLKLFGTGMNYDDDLLSAQIENFVKHKDTLSKLDEHEKDEEKLPWYLLHPKSTFRLCWNTLVILLLVYTATVMPFRIAFYPGDGVSWQAFDWCLDALFMADVCINCISSNYNDDGNLAVSFREVFVHYLRTWLLLDIFACLPFDLILADGTSDLSNYNNILRLARLPRLYRLLRVARVVKMCSNGRESEILEKVQDFLSIKHTAFRMCSFFTSVLVCVHLMACMWFLLARIEGFGTDTWVIIDGALDESISDQYIASVYWTFTTLCTVGYGDITPSTYPERIMAIGWMIFGIYFFSFTIGSLSTIISNIDTRETILMTKLAIIDEFVRDAHLSRSLRMRLRTALKYNSEKEGYSLTDKHDILSELPKKLRQDVTMVMHQGVVKDFPFFTERDPMFAATVVPFLQHLFVRQGVAVYRENDYADEVYFIVKGWCGIVYGAENLLARKLQRGSYFGEIEVMESVPRKQAVVAAVDTDLLTMSKKLLGIVQRDFPSIYRELLVVAETRDRMNQAAIFEHKELMKLAKDEQFSGMTLPEIKEIVKKRACRRIEKKLTSSPKTPPSSRASIDLQRQVQDNETRIAALEHEIDEIYKLVTDQRAMLQGILARRRTQPASQFSFVY